MKVSVVVPVYNQEVYLREALESLKAQTLDEIEFIIINDGSTDSSIEIIKEYARSDERFIVVDKENGGVASAINTGNKMARGEYVAEMDSDDYVAPDKYEIMYNQAKKYDVDILKCNLVNFTGSGAGFEGVTEKIARPTYYGRVINPQEEKIVVSFPMYAWVSLYRRDFIIDNDIRWNEDVSSYNDNGFYWQTMSLAQRVMYLDEDLIFHRRDNEMSTVKNPEKMFNNFFIEHKFIKKMMKDRGVFEDMKALFFERKILNYKFALKVIPYEKKQEFFNLIAKDFREDISEDGLNEVTFLNPKNKELITEIVSDPNYYYYSVYVPETYKVSVIVPVHNAENFIRNTMGRLINQTLKNVEFIIVENGSTDRTMEIIREYKNKDPRIQAVSIGDSNAGNARNVGLSMAHGQYVIFLDADDEYDLTLLEKTFTAAVKHKADVVWFNSRELNALTRLTKPHPHAYNKANMPDQRPFPFSALKGNPFDSFIGWPWDKLYSMKHIRAHSLSYQDLTVSNDGYFNFLAMSKAKRITTLDDVLVTRIVGHGGNISATRHDQNPDNQIRMLVAIYEKLKEGKNGISVAHAFAERSIRSIFWLFTSGFKSREGVRKYFDLLVSGVIDRLELDQLDEESVAESRRVIWRKLLAIKDYQVGEYERFIIEVGGVDFEPAQTEVLSSYPLNLKVQDRTARLIFGQPDLYGGGKLKPWFNIILEDHATSNVTAVIDLTYMGHFTNVVRDTLSLSIALHPGAHNRVVPVVHQAEWDIGQQEMLDGIHYSFVGNVFTIHAKHSGQYTGFDYRLRSISTRSGQISFSVVNTTVGYDTGALYDQVQEVKPIRDVRLSLESPSSRTVFRVPSEENTGQDLLHIALSPYEFNNVVLSLDVVKLPNNKPATYDTLYLGLNLLRSENGLKVNVFQAEWKQGRTGLKDSLYYYVRDGRLHLGAKFVELWAAYAFDLTSVTGREQRRDYQIRKVAPELITESLLQIPSDAVFVNEISSK